MLKIMLREIQKGKTLLMKIFSIKQLPNVSMYLVAVRLGSCCS